MYLDSSVEREEVIHCTSVSPCLRTIGEITTNHPGDGEDNDSDDDDDNDNGDDDDDNENNDDNEDDDILTYLYP